MALISQVPLADVAAAMAGELEELLRREIDLAPGSVVVGEPGADVLPADAARTVVLPFGDGIAGEVTLVVGERLAAAMEAATPNGSLVAAARPVLMVGAAAIALASNVRIESEDAAEIETETLTGVAGEFAAAPLFEQETVVACVVVRMVGETSPDTAIEVAAASDERNLPDVAGHEFPTLHDAATGATSARPLSLLNNVAMEVTAELGRRRLKMRDVASLQPGSVLALDRAAGSPVDLRVNGALVLRGEVVVVDDDLVVRVAEIVVDDESSTARPR
jgi:flagellar motor switch protein FliN/FliY